MSLAAEAPAAHPTQVTVAHAVERRVRLCVPVLAGHRGVSERVAGQLANEPGCEIVTIRLATGSIIVERSEGALDPEALRARVMTLLGEARDDEGRPLAAAHPGVHPGPTRVARAVAHAFVGINADVRAAMGDRADLGTLLPVLFATAGLSEIGVTGKLPAPAWFNLLWWSLRSFMTFNPRAVIEELQRMELDRGGRSPGADGGGGETSGGGDQPDPRSALRR